MKKFSKESVQNFMLLHAEKLILGVCLVATGLIVWMSMGDDAGLTKIPSDLSTEADSSQQYIERGAWDELKTVRKGETTAKEKILGAEPVDPSKFVLNLIGIPTAALDPRQDPEIFPAEQLIARRVHGGVMMNLANVRSPLADLFNAPVSSEGIGGAGGRGEGDFGAEDFGGPSRTGLPEYYPKLERSGTFNEVNKVTLQGLHPEAFEISPETITTRVLDVVSVVAVVDFQKQATAFEKAFSESVAYNAKRDRPVYQFLEVERREISDQESEWQDISEKIVYYYPQQCPPSLPLMPMQMFKSAPEVIAPENYDPILTGVIPAFAMLDYQQLASHPALKQRREFPAYNSGKVMRDWNAAPGEWGAPKDPASDGSAADGKDPNELRKGSETGSYMEAIAMRKPGGQYRLVRFFDLVAPKEKSFEYRVRVWVGDPNQIDPVDGFRKNRGKRLQSGEAGEVRFAGDGGFEIPEMDFEDETDGNGLGSDRPEVMQDVNNQMLSPSVRIRLKAASDLQMMQERLVQVARDGKPLEAPFQVAELSKSGELEKVDLPTSTSNYAYIQYLRFARPSPWSEPVRIQGEQASAEVFAGPTIRSRTISMNAGAGEVEFEQVEPQIEIVVSSWVRYLGAKLPSRKMVSVGETLDFDAPAYVTHPISHQILAAENPQVNTEDVKKFIMPFRTGETIVDAFGGQQMEMPNNKKQMIDTPTEILTMDGNGKLSVSNQFDSATNYRNEIAKQDSSRFYGTPKRKKEKDSEDENDDFGL